MHRSLATTVVGLATLPTVACGSSDDLRPMLESELPTTTGLILYADENEDGPNYVDVYLEAERRWPDLTAEDWSVAAEHMVDGGTWDEVVEILGPTTTIAD